MSRYRSIVQGAFAPVVVAGKELPRGFYAACFVAAESEAQACDLVLASMDGDPRVEKLKLDWNCKELCLSIEEVTLLTDDDEYDESPQGFVIYDESARK
ncbi:MAG: hypothetical protein K9K30_03060 [Burkholderiaceae bacterium]|nr:hypothetical protein [Sulfuritalea sp.]MCF8174197.1 hypothetical protein [Burkholderiaceae bacterium]MCF8184792.1 hypothetical protein [Polynucleobacter sp.]